MRWSGRAVRTLLGATAHPGGAALSAELLGLLGLLGPGLSLGGAVPARGLTVADVACGSGSTLRLLGARGVRAVGVDVDPDAVRRSVRRGLTVVRGDATALPLAAGSLDAAICECSLSTMSSPEAAVGAVALALRPGGILGVTDVTAEPGLDPVVAAAVARLTTPRPLAAWVELLAGAGLAVELVQDRRAEALALVTRLRRRLVLLPGPHAVAVAAGREIEAGRLSYGLIVARRPLEV